MTDEKFDPTKEIEDLMSKFRMDASSVASGAVSSVADAIALPLKLPMPIFKSIAGAIAQLPKPPVPPGLPDPNQLLGLKSHAGQPREAPGFPAWTGWLPEQIMQKGSSRPEELTFLAGDISVM